MTRAENILFGCICLGVGYGLAYWYYTDATRLQALAVGAAYAFATAVGFMLLNLVARFLRRLPRYRIRIVKVAE